MKFLFFLSLLLVSLAAFGSEFVVVIASYNNEKFCEKNLQSVFEQEYESFRVVYCDDASTDGTYEKVKKMAFDKGWDKKLTLVRNPKRLGSLENYYKVIQLCKDEEIILMLDGDDWLAHEFVLEKLHAIYADPKIWLTYGGYILYPTYKRGRLCQKDSKQILAKNQIRQYSHEKDLPFSHLKTFYAWLFKKIKKEDLPLRGNFFQHRAILR